MGELELNMQELESLGGEAAQEKYQQYIQDLYMKKYADKEKLTPAEKRNFEIWHRFMDRVTEGASKYHLKLDKLLRENREYLNKADGKKTFKDSDI